MVIPESFPSFVSRREEDIKVYQPTEAGALGQTIPSTPSYKGFSNGFPSLEETFRGLHPTHSVTDYHRQNVDGLNGSHPPANECDLFLERCPCPLLTHAFYDHHPFGAPVWDRILGRSMTLQGRRCMGSAPHHTTGCVMS